MWCLKIVYYCKIKITKTNHRMIPIRSTRNYSTRKEKFLFSYNVFVSLSLCLNIVQQHFILNRFIIRRNGTRYLEGTFRYGKMNYKRIKRCCARKILIMWFLLNFFHLETRWSNIYIFMRNSNFKFVNRWDTIILLKFLHLKCISHNGKFFSYFNEEMSLVLVPSN